MPPVLKTAILDHAGYILVWGFLAALWFVGMLLYVLPLIYIPYLVWGFMIFSGLWLWLIIRKA